MYYILVAADTEVDLSAVELCKVFEDSHHGVKAAAIVRRADARFPEDLFLGDFYTTPTAAERIHPDVLEDN